MRVLETISIPRMYSACARIEDTRMQEGTLYRPTNYYCLGCKSVFGTLWRHKGSAQGFGDARAICPQCGEEHVDQPCYSKSRCITWYVRENETAPTNMILSVTEGKDFVSLKVKANTIRFSELLNVIEAKTEEEFRFDVKKRKTIFRRKVDRRLTDEFELGNPFDRRVFNISILYFLTRDSAANHNREALSHLLKTLRETLHERLEACCKHKIKSMHVSCGQTHGRLLFPLYNMAFRMVSLDAPNLPNELHGTQNTVQDFWSSRDINDDAVSQFADLDVFRRADNYISTLITQYHLPNVRSVRKLLQADLFAFRLLQRAHSITNNIDHLTNMYSRLKVLCDIMYTRWDTSDFPDVCAFLQYISQTYGTGKAMRLLPMTYTQLSNVPHPQFDRGSQTTVTREYSHFKDLVHMYSRLSGENRKLLPGVKFSELHDWLAFKVVEQMKVGFNFDVPEHIQRRLMMQKNSIRFFLPEKSTELSMAGKELHNCVGTYSKDMAANKLQIVLVADDNGKLVACLEIKHDILVQAKLKCNQPVAKDAKINAEVVDWAEKAGIEINTDDVRKFYLPAVVAAV